MKYKKGDILVNKNGDERKVLEVLGDLYFMSALNGFNSSGWVCTYKDLNEYGFTLKSRPKEDWTPNYNERYWCITGEGTVVNPVWMFTEIEEAHKNFLGAFRTKEEALARLQEIKDKIK